MRFSDNVLSRNQMKSVKGGYEEECYTAVCRNSNGYTLGEIGVTNCSRQQVETVCMNSYPETDMSNTTCTPQS